MADSFELVDGALEGRLAIHLRELVGRGLSLRAIAEHFAAQGFPVSRSTVHRWVQRIEVPVKAAS